MPRLFCCDTCGAARQNARLDAAIKKADARYLEFFGFSQGVYDPARAPPQIPYAQSARMACDVFGARTPSEWDAVAQLLIGRYERRLWQTRLRPGFPGAKRVYGRWKSCILRPTTEQRKEIFRFLRRDGVSLTSDTAERVFVQVFLTMLQRDLVKDSLLA